MTDLEAKARANHRNGNNCSTSLAMAFADVLGVSEAEAQKLVPPPRSIDGEHFYSFYMKNTKDKNKSKNDKNI